MNMKLQWKRQISVFIPSKIICIFKCTLLSVTTECYFILHGIFLPINKFEVVTSSDCNFTINVINHHKQNSSKFCLTHWYLHVPILEISSHTSGGMCRNHITWLDHVTFHEMVLIHLKTTQHLHSINNS